MYAFPRLISSAVLIRGHWRRRAPSVPITLRWRRRGVVLLLPVILRWRVTHWGLPHVWWRRTTAVWRLHHGRCTVRRSRWWTTTRRPEVAAGTIGDVGRWNVTPWQVVCKWILSIRGVINAAAAVEASPVWLPKRRATMRAAATARLLFRFFNVGMVECGLVEADATQ